MPRKPSPPAENASPDSQWVYEAVIASGKSYADLARAMKEAGLLNSADKSVPQKIVSGERLPHPGELDLIARVTGYPRPSDPSAALREELVQAFDRLEPAMKQIAVRQVSALMPVESLTPEAEPRQEADKER